MEKLQFSIMINAPKEKVWNTMFDDKTYREWSATFMPGSYYEGSWDQGSKILFLGPDENGKLGGMVSTIAENKPNEYMSIQHLGIVGNGIEDTTSEEAKKWVGFENYTFQDDNGQTEVTVDMDGAYDDTFTKYLKDTWPQALQKIKELAEK